MFPKVNGSVLEVLVVPKSSVSGRVVGVPILVLATRKRVEIENGIYAILGTLVIHD